jgi:hypothetical protein
MRARSPVPMLIALACAIACGDRSGAPAGAPAAPESLDQVLLLSLSVFPLGPDGRASSKPGPATLVVLRREAGEWKHETIEDPESNVFHKAIEFTPPGEAPGLLTIAGDGARLKLWRREGGVWRARTLWAPAFGGKHDRLRDVELADLDGDGAEEIVLATHDQGVVAIVDVKGSAAEARELDRSPETFVHEIELGDLDGDGRLEIYATPSMPNRLDGTPQHGVVTRYSPDAGGRQVFADLGERHAKEILVADVDGDGRQELYVAVEGRMQGGQRVESVEILRLAVGPGGLERRAVAVLEDHLCRVLVPADVDGDGRREIVAAPFKAGIWLLRPTAEGEWDKTLVDADSSGFEHATSAFDLDGDGRDEIYAAADQQGAVRRYVWNGSGFEREEIFHFGDALSGFTWNVNRAPAALVR